MNILKELQQRGFIEAVTDESGIEKALLNKSGVYVGFDPTADSLHLGNLVCIVALAWFEKAGIPVVALAGGATGKIGDPSGKSVERPLLGMEDIKKNVAAIEMQLRRLLVNPTVCNNDTWFGVMGWIEFLRDVGKHFRLGVMLSKEMVKTRVHSEEGMSYTEFSYQLMQAYDFYHLSLHQNVKIQMGGSDQWGNIVAGIELTRKLAGKEVYGITFPLLTRSDGKKFGKSEGGAIWLDPNKCSPYAFYQYLLGVTDVDAPKLLRMLTFVPITEIEAMEAAFANHTLATGAMQRRLAEEVTLFVHGHSGLEIAKKVTEAAKPGAETSLDITTLEAIAGYMPTVSIVEENIIGKSFADIAVESGLCTSKGEANRLIQNGGAYVNNKKVEDAKMMFSTDEIIEKRFIVLASGKKKKLLVKVL